MSERSEEYSAASGAAAETDGEERKKRVSQLGEKRFHSESSLQRAAIAEDARRLDADPGVFNVSSRRPSEDVLFTPRSRRPSEDVLAHTPPQRHRELLSPTLLRHRRHRAFSQPSLLVQTALVTRARRKGSVGLEVYPESVSPTLAAAAAARETSLTRRRTVSQPGPPPALTASAARAARRKPRTVMYADQHQHQQARDTRDTRDARDGEDKLSFRLVLPGGATPTDSGAATPIGGRSSPLPNGNFANSDARSLNSYRLFASVGGGGGGGGGGGELRAPVQRKRSVTDVQSLRSVDTQAPPPTSAEDKSRMTRNYLTLMLSVMYAILLVTLGIIVFTTDPFVSNYSMSPIYCLYLVGVGFLYLVFLMIDIRIYLNKSHRNDKVKEKHIEVYEDFFRKQETESVDGLSAEGMRTPQVAPPPPAGLLQQLDHNYCFSHGRHAGSFYLKMGAAGFALGHMVHSVLLLTTQLSYLVEDGYEECLDYPQIVLDFLYPIYSFVQLFFIFKYSNVIILRWKTLARFGFMHFIGSSLCLWVWTIVRETVLSLTIYAQSRYGGYDDEDSSTEVYSRNGTRFGLENLVDENCMIQPAINTIFSNFSLYLFPFSVEYNILIVGIFYIIWDNIGEHADDDDDDLSSVYSGDTTCKIPTASEQNGYSSNFVIHADCHASNRGIFGGLALVVLTVALIILGFIFSTLDIPEFVEVAHIMNDATKLALHSVMLVAVVMAYNQTRQLDVNQHPVSLLDDILLFICIPAFFMETIFTMVATIAIVNIIKFIDVIIMSIQIIVQTSFLVDALRRCSNTRRLRRNKPGRELVMFLLITNVAMWLFNTFSYKSPDSVDERYEYYGKVLWSILGHVSLPLIMFYRFHSSVCLADVWKSAYEPGSGH